MTSGYASFDYEILGHREGDLCKVVNTCKCRDSRCPSNDGS